jgi:hypothetical protein
MTRREAREKTRLHRTVLRPQPPKNRLLVLGPSDHACELARYSTFGKSRHRERNHFLPRRTSVSFLVTNYLSCTNLRVKVPRIPGVLDCWEAIDDVAQVLTTASSYDELLYVFSVLP